MTIFTFSSITLVAMMIRKISELNVKMKNNLVENMKLLDGMHEGLLILSKAQQDVLFCNRPAQKLLVGAINYFM